VKNNLSPRNNGRPEEAEKFKAESWH